MFAFDPATNAETPLHDFKGADGAQPSLLHDPLVAYNGALYGTAYFNGPSGRGAIYRINATGTFSLVYGFPADTDGCNPTGIAIVGGTLYGTLYGTTAACGGNGGGNVYALDLATGARKTLHSFASGSVPLGKPLVDNGVLFGVTQSAGPDHAGSAYRIDLASGAYTLLHTFTAAGNDGDQPSAGLTLRNGVLCGVTAFGPGQGINGTIFTINAGTGAEATAGTFSQSTGYAPFEPLLSHDGTLYGTTVDYLLESSIQQGWSAGSPPDDPAAPATLAGRVLRDAAQAFGAGGAPDGRFQVWRPSISGSSRADRRPCGGARVVKPLIRPGR